MKRDRQRCYVLSLFFGVFFLLPAVGARAQLSQDILSRYPSSIVYRIYQIDSKTRLSPQQQKAFAEYFSKQEKQANADVQNGNFSALENSYSIDGSFLRKTLSPLEYNDYRFTEGDVSNQLIKAIKFRNRLQLSDDQITKLLTAAEKRESDIDIESSYDDAILEDGELLTGVLTPDEYSELLSLMIKPIAERKNKLLWAKLIKYRIVSANDSAAVYTENEAYLLRTGISDARANNSLALHNKIDSIRGTYFSFKPLSLWKIDLLTNTLSSSQFGDALKERVVLKLTDSQIDTLIVCARILENDRISYESKETHKKYDATKYEARELIHILSTQQYESYLTIRKMPSAMTNEKKIWNRLKQYNLANSGDSVLYNRAMLDYELRLLVADERYHNDDSPENQRLKEEAEKNKPPIMKKLDMAVKSSTVNASTSKTLSW